MRDYYADDVTEDQRPQPTVSYMLEGEEEWDLRWGQWTSYVVYPYGTSGKDLQ